MVSSVTKSSTAALLARLDRAISTPPDPFEGAPKDHETFCTDPDCWVDTLQDLWDVPIDYAGTHPTTLNAMCDSCQSVQWGWVVERNISGVLPHCLICGEFLPIDAPTTQTPSTDNVTTMLPLCDTCAVFVVPQALGLDNTRNLSYTPTP